MYILYTIRVAKYINKKLHNNMRKNKLYKIVYRGVLYTGYNRDMLVEYIKTLKYNNK